MRIIAVILTLVLLLPIGVQVSVHGWYWANKAYIAQVMCENRDQPMLHCDGKCVLAQKLKQAEQEHEDLGQLPQVEPNISPFLAEENALLGLKENTVQLTWPRTEHTILSGHLNPAFHPPPFYS